MKKISIILVLFTILILTSCSSGESIDTDEQFGQNRFDFTMDVTENGITKTYNFSHVDVFDTFDDVLNYEYGEFLKVAIVDIQEFSEISNTFICTNLETNENIDIVMYKTFTNIFVGQQYYFHLVYMEEIEAYMLTNLHESIYPINNDNQVVIPNVFHESYGKERDSQTGFSQRITEVKGE